MLRIRWKPYSKSLNSYDLEKLNANIIDPIKLLLDKYVYDQPWEGIIEREVSRHRDKTNNNAIGYFHQCIFRYIDGCEVPDAGWDVIYRNDSGIDIGEGGDGKYGIRGDEEQTQYDELICGK